MSKQVIGERELALRKQREDFAKALADEAAALQKQKPRPAPKPVAAARPKTKPKKATRAR